MGQTLASAGTAPSVVLSPPRGTSHGREAHPARDQERRGEGHVHPAHVHVLPRHPRHLPRGPPLSANGSCGIRGLVTMQRTVTVPPTLTVPVDVFQTLPGPGLSQQVLRHRREKRPLQHRESRARSPAQAGSAGGCPPHGHHAARGLGGGLTAMVSGEKAKFFRGSKSLFCPQSRTTAV